MMIWIVVVIVIVILIIIVPLVIKEKLNTLLSKNEDYTGKIDHLSIRLFRGKIILRNLTINSTTHQDESGTQLKVSTITIRFKWKSLIKKILDLDIILEKPLLRYVSDQSPGESAEPKETVKETPSFKNTIEGLISFKINLEVIEGEIYYLDPYSKPASDLTVYSVNLKIENLSNKLSLSELCHIKSNFQLCDGRGEMSIMLRPMASELALNLDFKLESINLVLLNDLFRAYGKVDINTGVLDLSGRVVIEDKSIKGYLNPILQHMDFVSRADRRDTIFQKIWERIIASLFALLIDTRKNERGIIIPIEGRLDDPALRNGEAIMAILRKAVLKAYLPSFKHPFNLKTLWRGTRLTASRMLSGIFTLKS